METVVLIIMVMVCFSFILKLTCHSLSGNIALSALCAIFIIFSYEAASSQSKVQIADWLNQPELMLDASVWLTIDVAFQICFCVLAAKELTATLTHPERILMKICRWIPGILIFTVLFAILTEAVFAMTGMDFAAIGWSMAVAVILLFPIFAFSLKRLIPETDIRIEMLFMVNLIIAALGIVATVNGRTAAVGTNDVEWGALAGFAVILGVGTVSGLFLNKYITIKKLSKIK